MHGIRLLMACVTMHCVYVSVCVMIVVWRVATMDTVRWSLCRHLAYSTISTFLSSWIFS